MGIFLTGSLIQTIILINNENYAFPAYIVAYVMNI
jgi:choline transport protein